MENKIYEPHKSSIGGLDANLMALIAYLGGAVLGLIPGVKYVAFLVPIIIFILEKDSEFVKFHAMQSILLSVVGLIFAIIIAIISAILVATMSYGALGAFSIILIITWLISIALLVFFIIAAVKAYKYQIYKMPLIGNIAAKIAIKN